MSDQFKGMDIGRSYSTHASVRTAYKAMNREPESKGPLGRLCADGRILLRQILKK
jgi:hypothetical protein